MHVIIITPLEYVMNSLTKMKFSVIWTYFLLVVIFVSFTNYKQVACNAELPYYVQI